MSAIKIGIITYTHGTNFGQRLQNYALQEYLCEIGCDPYTVRQASPLSFGRKIKNKVKNVLSWIFHPVLQRERYLRKKKFNNFNKVRIRFHDKVVPFDGKNSDLSKQYDAFIVGSDQIWSPQSIYVGDNAFLKFASSKQKMTYAPSLAVDEIPDDKALFYKDALKDYKFISVREDKGAELLKKITGKNIEVVVDPTLLLDRRKWDSIRVVFRNKPKGKYFFAYFLGEVPYDLVINVQNKLGIQPLIVTDDTNMSPEEFVDSIADAEVVLTDSFHGTIFSVIYHVNFYNFRRADFEFSLNSRFDTLYRLLGITDRMYAIPDFDISTSGNLNFDLIDSHLKIEIENSKQFLNKEIYLLKEQ